MLDPDYSTTSPEDIVLFQKKQKFMRSVFDKVLHKDRGKNYVREHEHDFNSQEMCKELASFHTELTNAILNTTVMLSYATSAKINSWKGTTYSFNCHYVSSFGTNFFPI